MFKLLLLVFVLVYSSVSFAGGPLILGGAAGTTPVTYQNPTITLNVENGNLSTTISNADADTLLLQALALWNDVSSSNINLIIDQKKIGLDIDINNFENYLPNPSGTIFNGDDNLNPIVYDSTGEIIDAFFGVGQSDNTIGFAASILFVGNNYFEEGYAVINGKNLGLTQTTFKLLIAHEIGHFFGLDHSQVNINNEETDFGLPRLCSTNAQSAYPLMYPFVCRNEESLHPDDISSVSALYPSTSISNNFGTLQGRFIDANGKAVLGANIWAENTTTGEVISITSDYRTQNTGFYKLSLPSGNYTLHANSINTLFNGGSSIGRYANDINDRSFTSPHPISPLTYQGDTAGSNEIISIAANQTQIIDFAIDGQTAVIPPSSSGGGSSGAMSQITLLSCIALLLVRRRLSA